MYKNILGELLLLYIELNKTGSEPLPLQKHILATKLHSLIKITVCVKIYNAYLFISIY